MTPAPETEEQARTAFSWWLAGMRGVVSIPGLILMSAFVGFAGLAREAGLSLAQTVFMTGVIWALPAKVVLVGAILSGSGIFTAAFAVALSSVRLLPMVVSIVPEMRTPRTRRPVLYLLSHFVAVTSWVIAMARFPDVPRKFRTAFYGGLGSTLVAVNMLVVAIVFLVAARLPPSVSAALFFLTPMYFMTSLWGSARERAGHVALILGLFLGPLFHAYLPKFDLLLAGAMGGLPAYAYHRWRQAGDPA
jgi:predicted branched-subunit amino acid permease